MGNTRNLGDLLNTDSTIATADVADGGITTAKLADTAVTTAKITDGNISTAKLADDAVTQAKIGADAVGTTELANDVAISTSGAITTTGAFTSVGIDDNADATSITIDSSENVGIGTTSPTSPLGANFKVLDINSGVWGGNVNFSGNSGGYIGNRHSGNGGLGYYSASGQGHDFHVNGTTTSVLNIESDGDVNVKTGNLVIGTAGKGIDFSAQTLSSNIVGSAKSEILDHYETGQFNADITSTSGSGDVTIYLGNPENQASRYIRIGSQVTIFGSHVVQSWGSRSGILRISNLPFPVWAGGGYSGGGPCHFPADTRDANVCISAGGTNMHFSKNNGTLVGGTSEFWEISDLLTMKYMTYTFTYFTNIS